MLTPKTRRGVILLSGGGSGRPDRALANARCWLHMVGADVAAEVLSLATDRVPAVEDAAAMAEIDAAVEEIRAGSLGN